MLGRVLRWLTGSGTAEAASPPIPAVVDPGSPRGPAAPIFSSRAVRDASIVAATVNALTAYADQESGEDELLRRLETLTPAQLDFLQISAEPGLLQRCLDRVTDVPGPVAADLRRRLSVLGGEAVDQNPIQAAAGSALPHRIPVRPAGAGGPSAGTGAVSDIQAPITATAPDLPPPRAEDELPPVAASLPVNRPADPTQDIPRLARQTAEERRSRLLASFSDSLSASEASR